MKRLPRLVSLALHFSARRRLRAEDVAREFSVSVRTVYRDVAALEEAGFPITGTPGDGYVLATGAQLRPLSLTPEEAEALTLAARLLERSVDDALKGRLASALSKLESVLPLDSVRRVKRLGASVHLPPAAPDGPLSTILEAVHQRHVLRLEYAGVGRGELTTREVEPLGLVRLGTTWLVPAWCRLRDDVRVFRADRIRRAVPTGAEFVDRTGFTFQDLVRRQLEEARTPTGRAQRSRTEPSPRR